MLQRSADKISPFSRYVRLLVFPQPGHKYPVTVLNVQSGKYLFSPSIKSFRTSTAAVRMGAATAITILRRLDISYLMNSARSSGESSPESRAAPIIALRALRRMVIMLKTRPAIAIPLPCAFLERATAPRVIPIQCQQLKRYWHLPCIKNQIEYLGQNTLR